MGIPPADHPVWRRLVTEEVPFRPSFLGARMFLANVCADRRGPEGASRTALHVERLRTLYLQNQECRSARKDLAALRMSEIFMPDSDCRGWFKREATERPASPTPLDHPSWQRLVTSDLPFQPSFLRARRRGRYMLKVVAIDGASEHELPADTVTRDEPAAGTRGPYVPLAFRLRGDVFYVSCARWSELEGVAFRLKAAEQIA